MEFLCYCRSETTTQLRLWKGEVLNVLDVPHKGAEESRGAQAGARKVGRDRSGMTMQIQLQRHGAEHHGCQSASRAGRSMPTTPANRNCQPGSSCRNTPTTRRRHPSCRRSARWFVARWLSRDPLGERGGLNLYEIIGNNLTSRFDILGLCCGNMDSTASDDGSGVTSINLPGNPTPAQLAGYWCDQARPKDPTKPKPKSTSSRKCKNNCDAVLKRLMNEDPDVSAVLKLFTGKCSRPSISCSATCGEGIGGSTDPNSREVTLCANDDADYKQILIHELTHARQLCNKPKNKDCTTNLRMEMEAYFCGNPTGNSDFDSALRSAIGSSCGSGLCDGSQVQNLYDQLADWYNKNKGNFCKGNGPDFPGAP